MRNARVNQAGFFTPGDDLDRKTQNLLSFVQERIAVTRFTQGLGGHRPYLVGLKPGDTLSKAGQAVPAPLHGYIRQVALTVQAIALANGFFEVFDSADLPMVQMTNLQAKTVGPQVHSCQ